MAYLSRSAQPRQARYSLRRMQKVQLQSHLLVIFAYTWSLYTYKIFAITIPSFYRMDSSIAKFFSGFPVFYTFESAIKSIRNFSKLTPSRPGVFSFMVSPILWDKNFPASRIASSVHMPFVRQPHNTEANRSPLMADVWYKLLWLLFLSSIFSVKLHYSILRTACKQERWISF